MKTNLAVLVSLFALTACGQVKSHETTSTHENESQDSAQYIGKKKVQIETRKATSADAVAVDHVTEGSGVVFGGNAKPLPTATPLPAKCAIGGCK